MEGRPGSAGREGNAQTGQASPAAAPVAAATAVQAPERAAIEAQLAVDAGTGPRLPAKVELSDALMPAGGITQVQAPGSDGAAAAGTPAGPALHSSSTSKPAKAAALLLSASPASVPSQQ
jgi:hypothetical protein